MTQPTICFELTAANGEEIQVSLPAKFVVCHRCEGKGTHVNPAIDGHGLTAEDFADDPDFEEDYFAGRYDQTCSVCKGERVIAEIDLRRLTRQQRAQWKRHCDAEEAYRRDDESEAWLRRAESGERW